jgi:hypothetical protein
VEPLPRLAAAFAAADVQYVTIGVAGANLWARSGHTIFTTRDYDLFLPPDPDNLVRGWRACSDCGLSLWCGDEPLDQPRDRVLARQIVDRRALVRASDALGFDVDLTLVMAAFSFAEVFGRRRTFLLEGSPVQVASLRDIVASKAAVGREKDRLFLATHAEALRSLIERDD